MNKKAIVELFKRDLWKDQRALEIISSDNPMLIKQYENSEEMLTEVSVTRFLNDNGVSGIPLIENVADLKTKMPYYDGIRLFNLFVELDALKSDYSDEISEIKQTLLSKCEARQALIQKYLLEWRNTQQNRTAYPYGKLKTIVVILSYCLGIKVQEDIIDNEIRSINEYWNTVVNVPFRDATTKNMILNVPKLNMSHFTSDEERNTYLFTSIKNNTYTDWLDAEIIDIDFCSCIHDTTLEDDVISLRYHERTWNGAFPSADMLLWHGQPDPKRAAITFLMRYFRFGGRKAAYRLLHPSGHRIRFKYDNDLFYFSTLPQIMINLWPKCKEEYPNFMQFIETASRYLSTEQPFTDSFLEYYSIYKDKTYYTDVYPN